MFSFSEAQEVLGTVGALALAVCVFAIGWRIGALVRDFLRRAEPHRGHSYDPTEHGWYASTTQRDGQVWVHGDEGHYRLTPEQERDFHEGKFDPKNGVKG